MRAVFRACLIGVSLLLAACASCAPSTVPTTATANPDNAAPLPHSVESTADHQPSREGASGSTLKTVSCGKKRCKAGREACTNNGQNEDLWACIPKGAHERGESLYACDDPSDCRAPTTCCLLWASGSENFECNRPDSNCKAVPCSLAEATPCPQGQYCKEGFCAVHARASCGGDQPCPAQKPYCVWTGSAECASESGARTAADDLLNGGRVAGIYECTKPSDCGTQKCCTSTGNGVAQTYCMNSCDSGLTMTACDGTADCAHFAEESCGKDAACREKVHCVPAVASPYGPKTPPPKWLKLCLKDDE